MLAGARLRLGALVTEPDSDAIQLPFLGLALDQKLLIETGSFIHEQSSELRIAVIARPGHLKRFIGFFESTLDECPPEIEVPVSLRESLGTLNQLEVTVLILRGQGVQQQIVGRRIFRLIKDNSGYSVKHVWRNDAAWINAGLPAKTGWQLEEPDFGSAPQDIVLYLHESLKPIMLGPESDARRSLSKQMSVDIMFDLITKFVSESETTAEGTLGWVVNKKIEELEINLSGISLATTNQLRAKLQALVGIAE
jgi:hypothetical protein